MLAAAILEELQARSKKTFLETEDATQVSGKEERSGRSRVAQVLGKAVMSARSTSVGSNVSTGVAQSYADSSGGSSGSDEEQVAELHAHNFLSSMSAMQYQEPQNCVRPFGNFLQQPLELFLDSALLDALASAGGGTSSAIAALASHSVGYSSATETHASHSAAPMAMPRRFCPWCGAQTRESFQFCPSCGERLEAQPTVSVAP